MDTTQMNRNWRIRNPEATKAHTILNWEIRAGRVIPQPCEVCGELKAQGHHDDYSKPLDVRWLCQTCHFALHKATGSFAGNTPPQKGRNGKPAKQQEGAWPFRKYNLALGKRRFLLEQAQQLRSEGKSYSEIGKLLEISDGTAYKWLNPKPYK